MRKIVLLMLVLSLATASIYGQQIKKALPARAPRVTGVEVIYRQGSGEHAPRVRLVTIGDSSAVSVVYDDVKPTSGVLNAVSGNKQRDRGAGKSRSGVPEQTFLDYASNRYWQMSVLPQGDTVTMEAGFEIGRGLKITGRDRVIDHECIVAQATINSNTIQIWYTTNFSYKGTPQPSSGVPDGLVLKITRNGSVVYEAVTLTQQSGFRDVFPQSWGEIVGAADYRYTLNNKDVQTVEVFRDNTIGFTGVAAPEAFSSERELLYTVAGGTVLLKKVKLPDSVDGRSIFVEVSQYAVGDAYDRTGSIFLIPVGKEQSYLDALSSKGIKSLPPFISGKDEFPGLISTPNYDVPVELLRFFTPFGVRGYNHIKVKGQSWADSVIYKQDVTHLATELTGERWIGAYIGNWTGDGHRLSLKLKYYPSGRASSERRVIPLFNTVNLAEQAGQTYPTFFGSDSLRVEVVLGSELRNAQLVYITTGHGGWGGGDEFNQKLNTIYMDGERIFEFIPWREDCASYRNRNPASGNFSNGTSSSDLSRSNWCPGTVTNPVYIPLGNLSKGRHTFSVRIPQGDPQGSSFSYWCVSGVIVGIGK